VGVIFVDDQGHDEGVLVEIERNGVC